ncbi:fimbria/pilus periplasmic chaperone [Shigella boydii]
MFDESDKSIVPRCATTIPKLPYLAQSWIEDAKGNEMSSPLAVLPPVQRIDAMMNGQVKVQGLRISTNCRPTARACSISTSRNSAKSNEPNTLQIALQTRGIKLFWRPKALENAGVKSPWQRKVTLIRNGQGFTVNNPTPYS